jgi:prefoldin subunit 5
MNKSEKISFIKREVRELENQEQLFKQGLSSITSRKMYLKMELAELGAANSAPKGKKYSDVLTDKQRLDAISSLTK